MANYTENGVNFNVGNAGIFTGGMKISRLPYSTNNGIIQQPQKVINAIDIDWNNAEVEGLESNINSTSQLLKILGELYSGKTNNIPNIVILSSEEYEALNEYADNTLYFITGEYIPSGDNPGGGDEPGGDEPIDIFDNISTNLIVSYFEGEELIENTYTEDGEILLYPQRKYYISGTLKGYIKINTAGHNITDNTELVLNNVSILSEEYNYGIIYQIPENATKQKSLKITLARNSENYIYCSNVEAVSEDQPGAIYSTNNMVIQGAGYLSVKNNGGHGLRADEFTLGGSNIWIDASHDGIHAKKLYIIGGIYFINRANDAIGTSRTGSVYLFDGKIITNDNNILGSIIDSQQPGIYYLDNLLTEEQLENCVGMHLLNSSDYSAGHIYWFDEKPKDPLEDQEGGEILLGEDNQYHITHPYILIMGYLNNPLIFDSDHFGRAKNDDATIYLNNAYIETNNNTPVFYYEAEHEKIKIMSLEDSLNVIKNTYNEQLIQSAAYLYESDCIKSESNLEIEIKNGSNLYISSMMADGLDGGDVKINDSKGNLIITDCGQRGIKGNAIVIGPDAKITKSIISSYATDRIYEGICYVKNNCKKFEPEICHGIDDNEKKNSGFADIYGRNGKCTKGQFGTRNAELTGVLITGTICAFQKIDMGNADNLYYNEVLTNINEYENPAFSNGEFVIIENEVPVTLENKNPIEF